MLLGHCCWCGRGFLISIFWRAATLTSKLLRRSRHAVTKARPIWRQSTRTASGDFLRADHTLNDLFQFQSIARASGMASASLTNAPECAGAVREKVRREHLGNDNTARVCYSTSFRRDRCNFQLPRIGSQQLDAVDSRRRRRIRSWLSRWADGRRAAAACWHFCRRASRSSTVITCRLISVSERTACRDCARRSRPLSVVCKRCQPRRVCRLSTCSSSSSSSLWWSLCPWSSRPTATVHTRTRAPTYRRGRSSARRVLPASSAARTASTRARPRYSTRYATATTSAIGPSPTAARTSGPIVEDYHLSRLMCRLLRGLHIRVSTITVCLSESWSHRMSCLCKVCETFVLDWRFTSNDIFVPNVHVNTS